MNLHKHQLYLFEQYTESFKSWSAIIRINTEGKSLIMHRSNQTWIWSRTKSRFEWKKVESASWVDSN